MALDLLEFTQILPLMIMIPLDTDPAVGSSNLIPRKKELQLLEVPYFLLIPPAAEKLYDCGLVCTMLQVETVFEH